MIEHSLSSSFFWIFSGAALLATLALFTRQPLLIAYIVLGAMLGPYGFGLVENVNVLAEISHIGIIFLLFLIGLDMQPSAMMAVAKQASVVAIVSSLIFAATGIGVAYIIGYALVECLIIGAAMMFSSTIVGIKLLPTTALHHKRSGEFMVGILLLQDLIAIVVLLALMSDPENLWRSLLQTLVIALPAFAVFAYGFVKYILMYLIQRFDRFHEYIFLVALGWFWLVVGVILGASGVIPGLIAIWKPIRNCYVGVPHQI